MKDKIEIFDDETRDNGKDNAGCGDYEKICVEVTDNSEDHELTLFPTEDILLAERNSCCPDLSDSIMRGTDMNNPESSEKSWNDRGGRRSRWQNVAGALCRFICLTVAAAGLFYYAVSEKNNSENGNAALPAGVTEIKNGCAEGDTVGNEDSMNDGKPDNTENTGIRIINECNESERDYPSVDTDYGLSALMSVSDGVRMIVLHSHTSEKCSSESSVVDFGAIIAEQLQISGVETFHCTDLFDLEGTLGSYGRMNARLGELLKEYPDTLIVLDLHSSDTDSPVTFSIAEGHGEGWRENYRLACAVGERIGSGEVTMRMVPGSLGQYSGVLTLHVGIGGNNYTEKESKERLYKLISALIAICSE